MIANPQRKPAALILPEWPAPRMTYPAIENHPAFLCRYEFGQKPSAVRHYNPSICRVDGELVMAWRVQDEHGYSRIVAAVVGKRYQLGKTIEVKIEAPEKAHLEDPRLVVANGKLLLFIAQVVYGNASWCFIQRAFELGEDMQPVAEIPLPFGKNGQGTHEKNWMPFQKRDGSLGFVYQVAPEHVVYDDVMHWRTPGIERWRWGTVSGRTPAILLPSGDRYLALIGGHQAHARRNSEYWVGAYTFSAEAPHKMLSVSAEPILWASKASPAILNPFDPNWNPLCIFPAGLVLDGDHALVSLGINDSYCALMRFDLAELLSGHIPPSELTGHETILAKPGKAAPVGNIRVRSKSKQPIGEAGGPYKTGDEWFTSQDRVDALGNQVEVIR